MVSRIMTFELAVQGGKFKRVVRLGSNRPVSGTYPLLAVVQWRDNAEPGTARRMPNRRGRHGQPTCINSPGATQR